MNSDCSAPKFNILFIILLEVVSIILSNLWLMLEEKAMNTLPPSGVVAGTVKLLGNSYYGYQIMGTSRHTITKYFSDEKTQNTEDS